MSKPNILFISTDQLRSDCVGYAGKYPVKTPNINRLGAEGTVFTHAYTPFPPVALPGRHYFAANGLRDLEHFGILTRAHR